MKWQNVIDIICLEKQGSRRVPLFVLLLIHFNLSFFFFLTVFCLLFQVATMTRMATWRNGGHPTPPRGFWSCQSASSISTATFPGTWPMDFTYACLSIYHIYSSSTFGSLSFHIIPLISLLLHMRLVISLLSLCFCLHPCFLLFGQFAMVSSWTMFLLSSTRFFFSSDWYLWILEEKKRSLPLSSFFANLCVVSSYVPSLVEW